MTSCLIHKQPFLQRELLQNAADQQCSIASPSQAPGLRWQACHGCTIQFMNLLVKSGC